MNERVPPLKIQCWACVFVNPNLRQASRLDLTHVPIGFIDDPICYRVLKKLSVWGHLLTRLQPKQFPATLDLTDAIQPAEQDRLLSLFPNARKLTLSGRGSSSAAIKSLVKHCPRITSLALLRYSHDHQVLAQLTDHCRSLTFLRLDNATICTPLVGLASGLRELSLSGVQSKTAISGRFGTMEIGAATLLKYCTRLEKLSLTGELTLSMLESLRTCSQLRELLLRETPTSHTQVSDTADTALLWDHENTRTRILADRLVSCPHLQSLSLSGFAFASHHLSRIVRACSGLAMLALSHPINRSSQDLAPMVGATSMLCSLSLGLGASLCDENLALSSFHHRLTHLSARGIGTLSDLSACRIAAYCKPLISLSLPSTTITRHGLSPIIKCCTALTDITVATQNLWTDLPAVLLQGRQQWRKISLSQAHRSQRAKKKRKVDSLSSCLHEAIARWTTLEDLTLDSVPITETALEALGKHCTSLRTLHLTSPFLAQRENGLLSLIRSCTHIEELRLGREIVSISIFQAISTKLHRLHVLDLSQCRLASGSSRREVQKWIEGLPSHLLCLKRIRLDLGGTTKPDSHLLIR